MNRRSDLGLNDVKGMTFPMRDDVRPLESGQGYVLRMAPQNGLRGLPEVKKLLGKSRFSSLDAADADVLSRWFGAVSDRLAMALGRIAIGAGSTSIEYGGQRLERSYFVHRSVPRICPQCLFEGGYCFAQWDFSLVCACERHACALIDRCPFCQRALSWNRCSLSACDCGHALVSALDGGTPSDLEQGFSSWVTSCLASEVGSLSLPQPMQRSGLLALLRPLSLNSGLCLVYALASSAGYAGEGGPPCDHKKSSLTQAKRYLQLADQFVSRVLSGDPVSFRVSRPSVATHLLLEAIGGAKTEADRSVAHSLLTCVLRQGGRSRWDGVHPEASQMSLF